VGALAQDDGVGGGARGTGCVADSLGQGLQRRRQAAGVGVVAVVVVDVDRVLRRGADGKHRRRRAEVCK
jgi:hypothetical protein